MPAVVVATLLQMTASTAHATREAGQRHYRCLSVVVKRLDPTGARWGSIAGSRRVARTARGNSVCDSRPRQLVPDKYCFQTQKLPTSSGLAGSVKTELVAW